MKVKRDSEKTIQELLKELSELNRQDKNQIRKLSANEHGVILLDRNNPSDVEWYENDNAYDLI